MHSTGSPSNRLRHPPGNPHHWSLDDLYRHKEHVESFGLSLGMVQLRLSPRPIEQAESPNILLGRTPSGSARSTASAASAG
jgi:hypothetical protein